MRYLVEIAAKFSVEVVASSVEQANDFAETEALRLIEMMASLSKEGSPDECISFDTHMLRPRMIYPEKPQGKYS